MTRRPAAPRWALSFADLCLLLLGFFVLLQARHGDPEDVAAGLRAALGADAAQGVERYEIEARKLFEPGEALLLADARSRLSAIGAEAAAAHRLVRIESRGSDADSRRFDGWELSAARTAAVARAVAAGGLDQRRIEVAIPSIAIGTPGGQRIAVIASKN